MYSHFCQLKVYGSRRREEGHKRKHTDQSLGNVLVLIAHKHSKIDHADIEPGFDLANLADGGRIATGDVKEVPVGVYAKAALEKLGVWPSVESKMAMTVNVRAALSYVAHGEGPHGIVYATDAKVEPSVKVVGVFPDNSHDPIIYPVAAINCPLGRIMDRVPFSFFAFFCRIHRF